MYSAGYCLLFIVYNFVQFSLLFTILYSSVYCVQFCTVLFTVNMSSILEGSLGGQLLNLRLDTATDVSLWSHLQDCGVEWSGARHFGVKPGVVQ